LDVGNKQTVAADIRLVREILNLTQEEMVDLLNKTEPLDVTFTRPNLAKYEAYINMPPADKYKKVMSLLP